MDASGIHVEQAPLARECWRPLRDVMLGRVFPLRFRSASNDMGILDLWSQTDNAHDAAAAGRCVLPAFRRCILNICSSRSDARLAGLGAGRLWLACPCDMPVLPSQLRYDFPLT